jgi:group I intron endonuclease
MGRKGNDMKTFYVYLTTNLITGKQYVGEHVINPNEVKYYIGSGQLFLKSVRKYKEYNFFKEIIEWFDTREEAFNSQEKYIKIFNTLVPSGYNLSPKGGLLVSGSLSEDSLIKMRAGVSRSNKGMIAWNKDKNLSEEHKNHIKKSIEGVNHPSWGKQHSNKTKEKISKKAQERTPEQNPMYGKNHTEKTKELIRKKRLEYNAAKSI